MRLDGPRTRLERFVQPSQEIGLHRIVGIHHYRDVVPFPIQLIDGERKRPGLRTLFESYPEQRYRQSGHSFVRPILHPIRDHDHFVRIGRIILPQKRLHRLYDHTVFLVGRKKHGETPLAADWPPHGAPRSQHPALPGEKQQIRDLHCKNDPQQDIGPTGYFVQNRHDIKL